MNADDVLNKHQETDLDHFIHIENEEHDRFYNEQSRFEIDGRIHFSQEIYEECMAYPWQSHFNLYSEETIRLLKYFDQMLEQADENIGTVLEYGCGRGDLSCYLATKHPWQIRGFDLSEKGVAFANRLAQSCNLQARVSYQQMNAQKLNYPDNMFDLVIGKGVLHHIAKYPGTAEELHRVMKPGARAIFLENLGNGPIWRTIRRLTMGATNFGDINLSNDYLRDWAKPFSKHKIRGFHVLFMAKRFFFIREENETGPMRKGHRFPKVPWFFIRMVLTAAYLVDEVLFNYTLLGNYLGGMCLVSLRK